jgi:hypothetical protein
VLIDGDLQVVQVVAGGMEVQARVDRLAGEVGGLGDLEGVRVDVARRGPGQEGFQQQLQRAGNRRGLRGVQGGGLPVRPPRRGPQGIDLAWLRAELGRGPD